MLKISSPTPPASSRSRLAAPARLELIDPVQGEPHRVLEDPRRTATCTRLLASVARQRPQRLTSVLRTETPSTTTASMTSRTRGSVAQPGRQPPRQPGSAERPPEQDVVDDQLRRRRRHQLQERGEREQRRAPGAIESRCPRSSRSARGRAGPATGAAACARIAALRRRPVGSSRAPLSIVLEPLPAADPLAPGQCTTPRPGHFSSGFRTIRRRSGPGGVPHRRRSDPGHVVGGHFLADRVAALEVVLLPAVGTDLTLGLLLMEVAAAVVPVLVGAGDISGLSASFW